MSDHENEKAKVCSLEEENANANRMIDY